MKFKSILSLLDVKENEIKTLSWSFSFSFLQGVIGVILTAVPLALFLGRYSSGLLAYTYIFNGIISFFLGLILSSLSKRLSLFKVLQLPLIFLIVTILFFLGVIHFSGSSWVYFALVVWSSVNFNLTNFVGMTLVNQLFSLQQGKRFFGIISGGGALGGMIGGLFLDLLQKGIGPINLIFLCTVLLFATVVMICSIRYSHLNSPTQNIQSSVEKKVRFSLKKSRNKKYILIFFTVLFLLTFFYFVLDLIFNHEAKHQFQTESELTTFFGYFFGTLNALTFLFSFFFMGKLLGKFGILNTLFALISALGILTTVTLFLHSTPGLGVIAFWVLAFVRICDNVLRAPLPLPLLNQPLSHQEKVWAQIQEQLVLSPLSTVVSGLTLLGVTHFFGVQFALLAILLIATAFLICVCLFYFKKEYTNILMRNLAHGSYDESVEIATLTPFLSNSSQEVALFAIQMFKDKKSPEYFKSLEKLLNHPSPEVRLFALEEARYFKGKIDKNAILKFLQSEQDPKLISLAFLSLSFNAEKNPEILRSFDSFRSASNADIQSSTLVALFLAADNDLKNEIHQQIISYVSSPDPFYRQIAVKFLQEVDLPEKEEVFGQLLTDPEKEVKIAVIKSLDKAMSEKFCPVLIEQLLVPSMRPATIQSLTQTGSSVIDYIDRYFDTFSPPLQEEVVKFLGYNLSKESVLLLEKLLLVPKVKLFHAVLTSLRQHSFKANERQKKILYQLLDRENKIVLELKSFLEPLNRPETAFLKGLLERELQLAQKRMIYLLSFMFSPQSLISASRGLMSRSEEIRSFAVELLLENLPRKEKNSYLNQIVFKLEEPSLKIEGAAQFWDHYFATLLQVSQNRYVAALASACVFTISKMQLKGFTLTQFKFDEDPYFEQMVHPKGRLEGEEGARE